MSELTSLPPLSPERPRRSADWRAAMEPLWHRREVEAFGTLLRVRVPIIGAAPDSQLAVRLSESLGTLWAGRTLSTEVTVHAVVAEFHTSDAGTDLVLLLSTDLSPRDHTIVGTRMIRDLRQALRLVRQPDGGTLRAQAA